MVMLKHFDSLEELKKTIYISILPLIILGIFLIDETDPLAIQINKSLMIWLFFCWLVIIFKKKMIRFLELINLLIISLAFALTVFDSIRDLLSGQENSLGDYVVWSPLLFIYVFLTLRNKLGLIFSLVLLALAITASVLNADKLSAGMMAPIFQFFFANTVYIAILYFAKPIITAQAEFEKMKKNAFTDTLTGIANRLKIDTILKERIQSASKCQDQLAIIFFDIDNFKYINDRFGHNGGDEVLKEFAAIVKEALPKDDFFGRWGGEEFIIVLRKDSDEAVLLAEKLRMLIASHKFRMVVNITSSFGVASYRQGDTIESIIQRADEGLYHSKEFGKNQVNYL